MCDDGVSLKNETDGWYSGDRRGRKRVPRDLYAKDSSPGVYFSPRLFVGRRRKWVIPYPLQYSLRCRQLYRNEVGGLTSSWKNMKVFIIIFWARRWTRESMAASHTFSAESFIILQPPTTTHLLHIISTTHSAYITRPQIDSSHFMYNDTQKVSKCIGAYTLHTTSHHSLVFPYAARISKWWTATKMF